MPWILSADSDVDANHVVALRQAQGAWTLRPFDKLRGRGALRPFDKLRGRVDKLRGRALADYDP